VSVSADPLRCGVPTGGKLCVLRRGHGGPHSTDKRHLAAPENAPPTHTERRVGWRRQQDREHAADAARADGLTNVVNDQLAALVNARERFETAEQRLIDAQETIRSIEKQLAHQHGLMDQAARDYRAGGATLEAARGVVRLLLACDDDMEDWTIRMEHGLKTLAWVLDA
jgi:hypothetical protein